MRVLFSLIREGRELWREIILFIDLKTLGTYINFDSVLSTIIINSKSEEVCLEMGVNKNLSSIVLSLKIPFLLVEKLEKHL